MCCAVLSVTGCSAVKPHRDLIESLCFLLLSLNALKKQRKKKKQICCMQFICVRRRKVAAISAKWTRHVYFIFIFPPPNTAELHQYKKSKLH